MRWEIRWENGRLGWDSAMRELGWDSEMRKLERDRVEKMGRWNEVNVLGGREKVGRERLEGWERRWWSERESGVKEVMEVKRQNEEEVWIIYLNNVWCLKSSDYGFILILRKIPILTTGLSREKNTTFSVIQLKTLRNKNI